MHWKAILGHRAVNSSTGNIKLNTGNEEIKYNKIIKSLLGEGVKEKPAGLGFMVQAILGIMGSQSLPHLGALSVRLSERSLILMAVCTVRSSCVLYQ